MKFAAARDAAVVILVAMLLLLGGCGGRTQQSSALRDDALAGAAPPPAQLAAMLEAELERLGVDPDRSAAAAPQGEDNRVFFLTAYVDDPDGGGPQVPTSVTLRWVERVTGDYNQDGLVGVSDLTPLGQRFNAQVQYYDPEQRGLDCWPVGPPLDDGGAGAGNPPVSGSPADNWRLARIDGNTDGLIGVSDITPIAQHWQERLSGYRVYRIRPGEPGFTALPNPADPGLGYTVPRSAAFPAGSTSADPLRPVHYEFLDEQLGAASGVYEYYVVPYDASADEEGTPSNPVPADMGNGGGGSLAPHAILMPDTDHGEFPLTVSFDAGASWDQDGVIVKYEWDMDGDLSGWEVDSGTNPVMSGITYNTAGTKDQWVRVTDNDGLTATAHAKVAVGAAGGNLPPVAMVFPTPPEGEVPQQVTWNASESFDHDGTIAKYEWDMDGDPTSWEYDSGTTATMEITYNTGGPHTQYVRVTDDGGMTDTAYGTAYMFGGNQAPTAVLVPDVTEGDAPLLVNFDASASSDPDGTIQDYYWDFDGDGTTDIITGLPTTSNTYTDPGDYQPSVRVIDDVGEEDSAATNITAHGWAVVQVDAGPSLGTDVSLAAINGSPAIAYSMENIVSAMELRYIRAEDAHGAAWPASAVVVDDGGTTTLVGTAVSLAEVYSRPAIAYQDDTNARLLYIRADDLDGASWPVAPVQADPTTNNAGGFCSLAVIGGQPSISEYYVSFGDLMYVRALDQEGTSWSAPYSVRSGVDLGWYSTLAECTTTTDFPVIAHYDHSNQQVLFERATDATGATWTPMVAICSPGDGNDSVSLAVVGGLPAVVYFGLDQFGVPGLNYIKALDTSFNWSTLTQLVTGGSNGLRPCIAEIGGYPAVAYKYEVSMSQDGLRYIAATDVNGSSWGTIETVDAVHNIGHELSLAEVDGRPAIAYMHNGPGELWYAYRY